MQYSREDYGANHHGAVRDCRGARVAAHRRAPGGAAPGLSARAGRRARQRRPHGSHVEAGIRRVAAGMMRPPADRKAWAALYQKAARLAEMENLLVFRTRAEPA